MILMVYLEVIVVIIMELKWGFEFFFLWFGDVEFDFGDEFWGMFGFVKIGMDMGVVVIL